MLFDAIGINGYDRFDAATGKVLEPATARVNWDGFKNADLFGLPNFHGPSFSGSYILIVLPAVIALIAENTGHVKAVAQMTGTNLDDVLGDAIIGDGVGTIIASAAGGSPTTTYAENIGVMAATRVYSTAAYYVAGLAAILFGLSPKFGALVNAVPGAVLGGITLILYGMIGLLGAKIWIEHKVDFGNPINLFPISAGIIAAIGGLTQTFTKDFVLVGIASGTVIAVLGWHKMNICDHNLMQFLVQHKVRHPNAFGEIVFLES